MKQVFVRKGQAVVENVPAPCCQKWNDSDPMTRAAMMIVMKSGVLIIPFSMFDGQETEKNQYPSGNSFRLRKWLWKFRSKS